MICLISNFLSSLLQLTRCIRKLMHRRCRRWRRLRTKKRCPLSKQVLIWTPCWMPSIQRLPSAFLRTIFLTCKIYSLLQLTRFMPKFISRRCKTRKWPKIKKLVPPNSQEPTLTPYWMLNIHNLRSAFLQMICLTCKI